jgi:hypothetical protein
MVLNLAGDTWRIAPVKHANIAQVPVHFYHYSTPPKAGHGSAFEFNFWRLSDLSGFWTIWNPDVVSGIRMASLDRFVNKKKYFIHDTTV